MKKYKIAIINGPNINILGKREPKVYGYIEWEDIEKEIEELGEELNLNLFFFQSNHEGAIVDFVQQNMDELSGIVINPAAFTKGGYSILESINAVKIPYVEVHITNLAARGGWHMESIFSSEAIGVIMGFREKGYLYGVKAINDYLIRQEITR